MNGQSTDHHKAPWIVWLCLAVLLIVGATAVHHSRVRLDASVPRALEPLLRDLCKHVPFYIRAVDDHAAKALRSGKRAWIPNRLILYVRSEADRITKTRMKARWKLKHLGTNAWPATPALLSALNHASLEVRWAAADVLVGIKANEDPAFDKHRSTLAGKTRPADALVWVLLHKDEFQRSYDSNSKRVALALLAACGSGATPAMPALQELARAKHEEHELRSLALVALGAIGTDAGESAPMLKELLRNEEEWPDVRGAAAVGLAGVAPKDEETPVLLRKAHQDKAAMVRIRAAEGLRRLGAPPEEILPGLVDSLRHQLASVRCAALGLIADMGGSAQPAKAAVEVLLTDEKPEVRGRAAAALERIGKR